MKVGYLKKTHFSRNC